ncbi:hypothetical protein ACVIM9_008301 [Bradyrhizobium sp. USDA 4520]
MCRMKRYSSKLTTSSTPTRALVSAGKGKFQADPFVIALAKVSGYTVITEETGIGSLGKIPGVCTAMKIECINLMQLIDEEDWVLG